MGLIAMPAGNEDLETLGLAASWAIAGHKVAIATVETAWGSAPRRVGSHLAIRDDGAFAGSVSGGCVEGDVITEARVLLAAGTGQLLLNYGVADETAWQVGLACGGKISIRVQRLADDGYPCDLITRLQEAAAAGRSETVLTDPATGQSRAATLPESDGKTTPDTLIARSWAPPRRLAVIGAVHIAQALVPLAQGLGMAVTVIDPRTLFATETRFAGLPLDRRWPDEALADWAPNAASAVVALTHDPKLDDVALAAALATDAYYVAALGSRKNHGLRRERLAARGIAEADLGRVHGPAGLPIGAQGPAEIALSIAAEMTAAWHRAPILQSRG